MSTKIKAIQIHYAKDSSVDSKKKAGYVWL